MLGENNLRENLEVPDNENGQPTFRAKVCGAIFLIVLVKKFMGA